MKNTIYILLVCLITFTSISASDVLQAGTKTLIIKPATAISSSIAIERSAAIISARLKVFGIANPVVTPLADKSQITVRIPDNYVISEIEGLLTLKGELAFYETLNRKELQDLLKGDNKLFGLLNSSPGSSSTEARIGCIPKENMSPVNALIISLDKQANCLLSWSFMGFSANENLRCLYALRKEPILNRSDIESVTSEKAKDGVSFNIMVTFKKPAGEKFKDATAKNLNRAIAITMDHYVYSAPVVRVPIEGGRCEISGNNTERDVNFFLALVNNMPLPVSFEIMK